MSTTCTRSTNGTMMRSPGSTVPLYRPSRSTTPRWYGRTILMQLNASTNKRKARMARTMIAAIGQLLREDRQPGAGGDPGSVRPGVVPRGATSMRHGLTTIRVPVTCVTRTVAPAATPMPLVVSARHVSRSSRTMPVACLPAGISVTTVAERPRCGGTGTRRAGERWRDYDRWGRRSSRTLRSAGAGTPERALEEGRAGVEQVGDVGIGLCRLPVVEEPPAARGAERVGVDPAEPAGRLGLVERMQPHCLARAVEADRRCRRCVAAGTPTSAHVVNV